MNQPSNRRGSNEEVVIGEIGQVGTQFDGFAHQSIEYSHYNCFKTDEIQTRGGFTKLGVEKVGTLITQGVLIDVAALKGVDTLPDTYEITVEDLVGVKAAEWLARQDPMLVGSDNWRVEVAPNPDPQLSLPIHQILLVVNGIHLLENMKLDELAATRVHEFAFVMQPLKAQGFSGSTVAPIAVR
jgi:hypothetical protein